MRIKPYHPVVLDLIRQHGAQRVLDAPCGTGWLGQALQAQQASVMVDGMGLYEFPEPSAGYAHVTEHDLNLPAAPPTQPYDAVVCGEAIHLVANPGVMLDSFRRSLVPGGMVVITTPNSWPPGSRLRYLLRGFHAGFAPSADKTIGQDYITYFPFTFGQLHLLLRHVGFTDIRLHAVHEPKPARWHERLIATPSRRYCLRQGRLAQTKMGQDYWRDAGSDASLLGRWLVVSARAP